MTIGPQRFEKCIADTQQAVAEMSNEYWPLGPREYVDALKLRLQQSRAYRQAFLQLRNNSEKYLGDSGGRMVGAPPAVFRDALPPLFTNQGFPIGIALGLDSVRRIEGDTFDEVMTDNIRQSLTHDGGEPFGYAPEIASRGVVTYDNHLDSPPELYINTGEPHRSQLRSYAEGIWQDLKLGELDTKYARIGLGIARHAYNSYLLFDNTAFEQIMLDSGYNPIDFT